MVSERQQLILETLIDAYIRNAFPISSNFLKQEGGFECSSATLRNELAELAENGYLEKTHLSGGRVPTDKGYRFFVDQLIEKGFGKEKRFMEEIDDILADMENVINFSRETAKILAEFSHNLGVVSFEEIGGFWKEGWENLMAAPEFQDITCWKNFIKAINQFEKSNKEKKFWGDDEKNIQIFIGKEAPLNLKDFSCIIGESKNRGAIFAIFGPRRMNFRKNISLISSLIDELNNL